MDLNELKNLNIDDLKAKVLALVDKKTLIKGGITFETQECKIPKVVKGFSPV